MPCCDAHREEERLLWFDWPRWWIHRPVSGPETQELVFALADGIDPMPGGWTLYLPLRNRLGVEGAARENGR